MIKIGNSYCLSLLRSIEKNDFSHELTGHGVYLCEVPTPKWLEFAKKQENYSFSTRKKLSMFNLMGENAVCLSASALSFRSEVELFKEGNIIHLPCKKFYAGHYPLFVSMFILYYIIKNRRNIDYILTYNIPFYYLPAVLFLKFRGTRVILELEDDYLALTNNTMHRLYYMFSYSLCSSVILVNSAMRNSFSENKKKYVFNGFIDLNYVLGYEGHEIHGNGRTFLFSSTLDNLRGANLIPDVLEALSIKFSDFKLIVTGVGPLDIAMRNIRDPRFEFKGFLDEGEYLRLLAKVDFCLVLQSMNSTFGQATFPSKIEYYSMFRKPILVLNDCRDCYDFSCHTY